MRLSAKLFLTAALMLFVLPCRPASAVDERDRVLRRLDAAAVHFQTIAADFQFDTFQTDPIPDQDTQKGTVYFERKGGNFQMAVHQTEFNGKPVPKIYGRFGGTFKMFDPKLNEVTTTKKFDKYESFLMLGFGASGKDLEDKWEIKYLGPETLDGVKTEKLELIAKDEAVRKTFPKITVWMDTDRGISMKQVFDEGPGQYRVSVYFNIKLNQPLPGDAFTLKTDKQTTYTTR